MKESPYIRWAKTRRARYNLARSGVVWCPPDRLDAGIEDHVFNGPNSEGWRPLVERIARRYGVAEPQVVVSHGCSTANLLAFATLLETGDHVLVESPGYEPLHSAPRFLRAEVEFFERRAEDGYRVDPSRIAPRLTSRTRLVVVSDLHNPSGVRLGKPELRELVRLAEAHGFHLLVDEVYLEFLYDPKESTAARLSPQVLATRSLTKAYGLDGLRAGWILAAPALAGRLQRLNDLLLNTQSHPSERLAARAIDRAEEILGPVRRLVADNRRLVEAFLDSQPRLSWIPPAGGTVGFVRLAGGSVDDLVDRLEAEQDTTIAPGRFFGAPDHFRIGFGMETEILEEGLARLGGVLGRSA